MAALNLASVAQLGNVCRGCTRVLVLTYDLVGEDESEENRVCAQLSLCAFARLNPIKTKPRKICESRSFANSFPSTQIDFSHFLLLLVAFLSD